MDKIANCADYGTGACVAPYQQWAAQNCMNFCGMCSKYSKFAATQKKDQTLAFKTNNRLMRVKSIAGCSKRLLTFIKRRFAVKTLVLSFFD